MADEFFWSLSPRLFGKLVEHYRERERRDNLRAGFIVAELRNANRTKDTDKLWSAFDFFPEKKKQPEPPQTEEEMIMAMRAWVNRTKRGN